MGENPFPENIVVDNSIHLMNQGFMTDVII